MKMPVPIGMQYCKASCCGVSPYVIQHGFCQQQSSACSGLDRFEARKKLWADMETAGLVLKSEPYTLRVPRSQRGGEVSREQV